MNLMILMRQNDLQGLKRPAWDFFLFSSSFFHFVQRCSLSNKSNTQWFFLCSPLDEEGLAALKTSNTYSLVMTHEVLVYQCNVLLLSLNAYSLLTDGPESNQDPK